MLVYHRVNHPPGVWLYNLSFYCGLCGKRMELFGEKYVKKTIENWESHGFVGEQHGILLFFEKPLFKKLDVDGTWMGSLILGINMNLYKYNSLTTMVGLVHLVRSSDMFHQPVPFGVFFHPMGMVRSMEKSHFEKSPRWSDGVFVEQWHGHGY